MLLCISSSFSLDRGSYKKSLPQIRIDRDSEENGFFWKKDSDTDLWMNYPKMQQNQHNIENITILFCTIVPLRNGIFNIPSEDLNQNSCKYFSLKWKHFGGTEF